MERRDFLRVLPASALVPSIIAEGVQAVELPKDCHLLILANIEMVDYGSITELPRDAFPKNMTGGYVLFVKGNPDEAIKFYNLKES